jgi:hypothetical protein
LTLEGLEGSLSPCRLEDNLIGSGICIYKARLFTIPTNRPTLF